MDEVEYGTFLDNVSSVPTILPNATATFVDDADLVVKVLTTNVQELEEESKALQKKLAAASGDAEAQEALDDINLKLLLVQSPEAIQLKQRLEHNKPDWDELYRSVGYI